ncbi:S1 family peptidase [Achromobacter xylosoxidans]|uniref:S1 family peptidase n=1 Tax=Alcaligenes xylosoxydans xylosoxydans TaxID=85698 RepID=UPI0006C3DDDF|nr:serine protease [Achromobacter xylosoxidans]MDD7987760.1 serine protease [Achromobacter xylosoxidans]PNL96726.1 serine protease [Achromobacter xylosoxidans]CUI36228.1 Uncharacterised protein [Achromobacter xylosoxidans]CUJ22048.1 Uncharacterised protein [Achromobacter xylosoxidans]CUJ95682.1 Uncharacterised protein [Achromobacter xylosoxidans]
MVSRAREDRLQYTTVLIHTDKGGKFGRGTGFLFMYVYNDGSLGLPVIVTNKHVVKDAKTLTIRLSISSPSDNNKRTGFATYTLFDWEDHWFPHTDEDVDLGVLAIAPIFHDLESKGHQGFGNMFAEADLIKPEERDALKAVEPILMVGYPRGLSDELHNLPLTRKGITATPANVPFNGKREFLIDCACFPGSSGSPVVHAGEREFFVENGGAFMKTPPLRLLGILHSGPTYSATGQVTWDPEPMATSGSSVTPVMINIGMVIQAERLLELKSRLPQANTARPYRLSGAIALDEPAADK